MCLIINRPAGVPIPVELLQTGLADNPHGWGIMRAHNDKIVTKRGMDARTFWSTFSAAGQGPLTIHFRWATHGTKDIGNTHPFLILGGRYAVMHNGIIATASVDKSKSDTWHFCEYTLAPILKAHPDLFGSDHLATMLGNMVGSGNKLVILRSDGAEMIVNRKQGDDHEGLWLSNTHSLPGRSRWAKYASYSKWSQLDRDDYATSYRSADRAGSITLASDDPDDCEDYTPTRNTSRQELWQIADFVGWTYQEILDYIYENPEDVANLIDWECQGL